MIKEFYEKNRSLIQIVAYTTAIGALFLNIPKPENVQAQNILLNIQMFWLILITAGLSSIFVDFVVFIIYIEKELRKKEIPVFITFSLSTSFVVIWFLFNLWNYIFLSYSDNLSHFLHMLSPVLPLLLGTFFLMFIFKRKFSLFTEILSAVAVMSFMSAELSGTIEKYFKYNLNWATVYLLSFLLFSFTLLVIFIFIKIRKKWNKYGKN